MEIDFSAWQFCVLMLEVRCDNCYGKPFHMQYILLIF